MDPRLITPVLIGALVIWGLYRRARRFIGRQRLVPGQLWTRIGIFAALGGLMLVTAARDMKILEALLAGACCGAVLGWVSLKYTRFETTPEGGFYTPHAYIGLLVIGLLAARILYRFALLYSGGHGFAPADFGAAGPNTFAPAGHNPYSTLRTPLTFGIFGTLVGYYVSYYVGVISKGRQPAIPAQAPGAE